MRPWRLNIRAEQSESRLPTPHPSRRIRRAFGPCHSALFAGFLTFSLVSPALCAEPDTAQTSTANGITVTVLGCQSRCLYAAGDGLLVEIGDDRIIVRRDFLALNGVETAARGFREVRVDGSGWGLDVFSDDEKIAETDELTGLRKFAARGNAFALNDLALRLASGLGVPRDATRAADLYRRAAMSGVTAAARNLGVLLWNGSNLPQDQTEAIRWFRMAAEAGDITAQTIVAAALADGVGTAQDLNEALRWYEAAAKAGDPVAMNNLANLLKSGPEADPARAALLHRKAAEKGLAVAAANYGFDLWRGTGVSQDRDQAVQWFERAAKAGSEEAKLKLNEIRAARRDGESQLEIAPVLNAQTPRL